VSALAAALVVGGISTAQAGYLQIGGGVIQDLDEREKPAAQVAMYFDPLENFWDMEPYSGLLVSEESTFYLNLGLSKGFNISNNWNWGITAGAGYFYTDDEQMDLEYDVEFLTRIFLDYHLTEDQKLRLEFGHLSNAGLSDDDNPGTEMLMLNWMKQF